MIARSWSPRRSAWPAVAAAVLSAACGEGFTSSPGGTTTSSGSGGAAAGGGAAGGGSEGGGGPVGCSDDTRELFVDPSQWPGVAGCAGGFRVPGTVTAKGKAPQCNLQAGNDGQQKDGDGCSVEDLCAAGWHVCRSLADFAQHGGDCSAQSSPGSFWVTRQSMTSDGACNPMGTNNLVGCGYGIGLTSPDNCAPLDRQLDSSHCAATQEWECGGGQDTTTEAQVVVKNGPNEGGAICCRGPKG